MVESKNENKAIKSASHKNSVQSMIFSKTIEHHIIRFFSKKINKYACGLVDDHCTSSKEVERMLQEIPQIEYQCVLQFSKFHLVVFTMEVHEFQRTQQKLQ